MSRARNPGTRDHVANPVTPWSPSRRAVAKVANPLPVPDVCRLCGAEVDAVKNDVIYNGQKYGKWPWVYLCRGCGAHVGMHPFTGIPLGTLALKPLREARKQAKAAFNVLWHGGAAVMTRSQAYAWLAGQLGIHPVEACHIGWFEEPECKATVVAVRKYLEQ